MTFLKKQSTAIIITIVVAIVFSFIGSTRSLSKLSGEVEAMFTEGVYIEDENYMQPSIQSQLDKRIDAALGLMTVANHYPELEDEVKPFRGARGELIDAVETSRKFLANEALSKTGADLIAALDTVELSNDDSEAADSYISTFNGSQGVIEKSEYNGKVSEYIRTAQAFPANIFGFLAHKPEYFQVEG